MSMIDHFTEEQLEMTREGVHKRGEFIQRYSGIEYSITHFLAAVTRHPAYSSVGELGYSVRKKEKQFEKIISMPGPVEGYNSNLKEMYDAFASLNEYRKFIVHGIMIGRNLSGKPVCFFSFYTHVNGVPHASSLELSISEFDNIIERAHILSLKASKVVPDIVTVLMNDSDYPSE
ncbi:hypothetical protein ACMAUO_19090 [Gluconacetobacter sp. Hr-1-5]|uniref:hypothetical protein n=1 Tax=Gluconacetobacter sp. Hr-1-5 TaxID=3395370 RepID=UPI003B51D7E8